MEPHDLVEEGLGDICRVVGVVEGDEVCVFGEEVDHREDLQLVTDLRESLNEIHGGVGLDGIKNVQ